jgi:hypothetical protein
MKRLKVREVELINEYFAGEQDGDARQGVEPGSPRWWAGLSEEERAEQERRLEARIALQAELDAEQAAVDG